MDGKLVRQINSVRLSLTLQNGPRALAAARESVSLEERANLDQALSATPALRFEAMDRARKLIADDNYPSQQTMRKLAAFFAAKLGPNSEPTYRQ